jgi:acyl-CoA thioesterase YciA
MERTYLPPNRQLSVRTTVIDTNSSNFGGWLVSQMHTAGKIVASTKANCDVEAVAINDLIFHKQVALGDDVNCYAEVIWMNSKSLTIYVEAWVHDPLLNEDTKISEGMFIYATSSINGALRPSPKQQHLN